MNCDRAVTALNAAIKMVTVTSPTQLEDMTMSREKGEKVVCVWKDVEYHPDGEEWIVSIDCFGEDGNAEYSDTKSTHKTFAEAKEVGEQLAASTGYALSVCE